MSEPLTRSPKGIALGLLLAGVIVYANSFGGTFVLDDLPHIVDNPGIRTLRTGLGIGSLPGEPWRPLTTWTFALNYAAGGLNPAGYHAVNLLIHLLAGLTLFALVRGTLEIARERGVEAPDPVLTAGSVALLWLVHPLQTESVTYLVQRGESLAGLLHVLVLWCALHAWRQPGQRRWPISAWLACAAGMAAKESMVVAPLAVVLYDVAFLFPSWAAAWRQRARLWVGLAATWLLLAALTPSADTYTPRQAGLAEALAYALTQPGVILHYLRLSLWPVGLTLEESWPLVHSPWEALPGLIGLGGVAALVLAAGRRHVGVLAVVAWTSLVLAPTSSVVPLRDSAVEHRMYLPLAGVVLVCTLAAWRMLRRLMDARAWPTRRRDAAMAGCVIAVAAGFGGGTIRRNEVYASQLEIYADVVAKRPGSLRGRQNLAVALIEAERLDEACEQLRKLVELKPDYAEGHYNLGFVLGRLGRFGEAEAEYRTALRYKPEYVPAQVNLRILQSRKGRRG